jgi:dipeptidyl aminopeptidase/acylaminoacyl peptidase
MTLRVHSYRTALAVLLAGLLLAAPAAAQTRRPLTVEDLWAVKRVGAPSVSPDGKWVVLSLTSYDMAGNSSATDLWLLSTDGKTQRRLTTHPASDSSPQWSPDGKWIAFTSRRDADTAAQIYVISPDGGEARRVTSLSTGASGIRWFPDSKRLAFLSSVWPDLKTDEEQARRARERADSKVKAFAVETTQFRNWDHWVVDGKVPHIFEAALDTGATRDLLLGSGVHLRRTDPSAGMYAIAPDGTEVTFVADLGADPGFRPNDDLVTFSLTTGQWKNITAENPAEDGSPAYSPDGKWLAYLATRTVDAPDRPRIILRNLASGALRDLTADFDHPVSQILWAPDSASLYLTAEEKGRVAVFTVALSGPGPSAMVRGGTISSMDLSADGAMLVFLRTTLDMPNAVFARSRADNVERQIESFNEALLKQWRLGTVESVDFRGWNKESVQMWVVYPPDFDRAKKWPLLQFVHGGPHGAWLDQFHFRWNPHVFAARGYVVALVNFHGSPGWGDAFTDSIKGMYGVKEMADIEAATDWLIAQGYVDPQRLTAGGGSFGGYLVAWMNGHTDRYKAYVCHAGVFDNVAQMASDYIRGRQRAYGGFQWENPEGVRRHSAHTYAKNFKTPTLVMHSELDFRVPNTQGFAYFTTLRMLGVPARLVYFPDENHWILKPQNSQFWHREFFAWIEKYAAAGPR